MQSLSRWWNGLEGVLQLLGTSPSPMLLLSPLGKEQRRWPIVKPQIKEELCVFHCSRGTVDQLAY